MSNKDYDNGRNKNENDGWDDDNDNDDSNDDNDNDEEEEEEEEDVLGEEDLEYSDSTRSNKDRAESHERDEQEPVFVSYESVLQTLQSPITNNGSNKQQQQQQQQQTGPPLNRGDPKMIRLAAVTCAIVDMIQTTRTATSTTTTESITAAQVYAQAITALEGTLKVTIPSSDTTTTTTNNIIDIMMDTFATTNAILELLCLSIPYISFEKSNILAHTLQSFTTRILSAVIQSTISFATTQLSNNTTDSNHGSSSSGGGGGSTAVLRNVCRVSTILLQHLPTGTKEMEVKQLIHGTMLQLFYSDTPKVRKAAQHGLIEVLVMSSSTTTTRAQQRPIHRGIIPTVNTYINKELKSMMITDNVNHKQTLQRCLHLLPFLERIIFYVNYQEISHSIMTYLTTLLQSTTNNSNTTNDYVIVKVKESTPKVLVIASILNLVLSMLQQEHVDDDPNASDSNIRTAFINQFAQRVIASLVQMKAHFSLATSTSNVEYEISEKTKLLYGQVIIASLQQLFVTMDDSRNINNNNNSDTKSVETLCTLLPLSIQVIIQLSKPTTITTTTLPTRHRNNNNHNNHGTMIAQTLFTELTQLIRSKLPILLRRTEHQKASSVRAVVTKCCHDVVQCMSKTIVHDVSYRNTWSISLPMISILIQQIHTVIPSDEVSAIVESVVVLHNDTTTCTTSNKQDIENALSTLIQGVGIESSWAWITWNSATNNSTESSVGQTTKSKLKGNAVIALDRAWILSVMKSATSTITATATGIPPRLEFFQKDVLELARQCDTLYKQQTTASSIAISARNASRTRVIELWNLFPCFCVVAPSDMVQVLPSLTMTLGRILDDKRYPELLTVICHSLASLVKTFESIDATELESMYDEKNALGETAKSLLPILFKFVTDTHEAASTVQNDNKNNNTNNAAMDVEEIPAAKKHVSTSNPIDSFQKLQCVSDAISALARLAPDGYMKGLFKKLMQRLLDEVQSETCDNERICAYLTLSQALVASKVLDESSSISFLYRALKPLITNHTDSNSARVQKRAYKVLNEICEQYHTFVTDSERLYELSVLFTGTIGTSQVSARYMRLKCFNVIIDGFDETNKKQLNEVYKVIPEVLLCLKDSNRKTRDAAYQLVLSMAVRGNIVEFVKVTLAALGSETSHMRSAVVMALSRLVFDQGWANDEFHALLPSLLKTILLLINEGSREVIKSVVGFIRICVAAIPADQLEPLVPELIGSMLRSQHTKSRFRAKIKIILKKLVKMYGYEALMPHVPTGETRLLSHMRKLDEREQRKKQAARNERASNGNRPNMDDYDAMFESDEDDSDDGRTLMTGATGLLTGRTKQMMSVDDGKSVSSKRSKSTVATGVTGKSKFPINPNLRLPNETNGEVVDLLSSKISKQVQFQSQQYGNDDEGDSDDDDDSAEMMFDDDGKLVVIDDNDDRKSTTVEMDEILPMQGGNKRRRLMSSSSSMQSRGGQSSLDGGGKSTTNTTHKKKNVTTTRIGASYQSKKAGGDVMKKGQMYEPYAFVPLDGRAYTKKHRRATVEQMATVVRTGGNHNKGKRRFTTTNNNNKRKR